MLHEYIEVQADRYGMHDYETDGMPIGGSGLALIGAIIVIVLAVAYQEYLIVGTMVLVGLGMMIAHPASGWVVGIPLIAGAAFLVWKSY